MLRLTREVRFAVASDGSVCPGGNTFAGMPPLTGLGHFFLLRVQVTGQPQPLSNYLVNIKDIDRAVLDRAVPVFCEAIRAGRFGQGGRVLGDAFRSLAGAWGAAVLSKLELGLSPFLLLSLNAREVSMVRLSQRFEFSASHRLFNRELTDEENRRIFGKCSNPHGHGHNYEVEVTVKGPPDAQGMIIPVVDLERLVNEAAIEPMDHRNLNVEVPEFARLIPSVENIAMVIYNRLAGRFAGLSARLASVRVWETPKTFAEYGEE